MEGSCHIWREPFCACCMCRSLGGNQNSKQVTNGCTPFFEFTMKQKFLFLLTLVYTLLSTPCLAGVIEQNGITYIINDDNGHATVTANSSKTKKYKGNINIPATIIVDNRIYQVTAIGKDCFKRCYELKSVSLPNTIIAIGANSFSECTNLKDIDIPSSVTTLKDECFSYCYSFRKINIPNSVIAMGRGCFANCRDLETVTLSDSLRSLSPQTFINCKNIDNIIIPSKVNNIGEGCFYWCLKLSNIKIPNSVTEIGKECFTNCSSLEKITLPDIKILREGCFAGTKLSSTKLDEIKLPQNLISIEAFCFSGCKGITKITLPDSLKELKHCCFQSTNIREIAIPSSVTYIDAQAFYDCINLTSITVDNSNTKYCSENGILFNKEKTCIIKFPQYHSMNSYDIPQTVINIGDYCFEDCRNLSYLTIPNNVKRLGEWCFAWCDKLNNIILPASINYIGERCFYYCSSLTRITIPEGITALPDYCFFSCDLNSITLPTSITNIGRECFQANRYLIDITIPEKVSYIEEGCFSFCNKLSAIICLSPIPPKVPVDYDSFCYNYIKKMPILYVPQNSVELYKSARAWKEFIEILPIETAGINDVTDTDLVFSSKEKGKISITGLRAGEIIQCYNASGLLIQTCKATSNEISIMTAEPIVIIKARKQTKKILVKL